MSKLVQLSAGTLGAEHVDTINGVIRGVSVITSGLVARGHDLEVDGVTLQQMHGCACARQRVPVKIDHKSGAAAVCGYLCDFRIEDGKLKADWHLLETHPQRDQILEVAQRMPRGVGLSASFVSPENGEPGKARCSELISVDYVTLPAANPDGLFSAKYPTLRPLTGTEKFVRAARAAGRSAEGGALAGTIAGILLRGRRGIPSPDATAAIGAVTGGLANAALQYRQDRGRDLSARNFQQPALQRLTTAVANNIPSPEVPGADEARAVVHVAKKRLVRRAITRVATVGAGSAIGYYAGRRFGGKAGAVAGGIAGALFESQEVRRNIRLSIQHANKINL